jgi:cyclic beta-1,2-glucan synthetase
MSTPTTADAPSSLGGPPPPGQAGAYVLGRGPIRGEILGPDRLRVRAAEIARVSAATTSGAGHELLDHIERDNRILRAAHDEVAAASARREPVTGVAEWLLDNFHIITEALREVRTDLPPGYYGLLPKLASGSLAGLPRVYWLALELIAHTDSALEETTITDFIKAYQAVTPLTIGELWAVPIMLRLVLVENLSRLADGVIAARAARMEARRWVERYLSDGPSIVPDLLGSNPPQTGRRAVAVLEELRGGTLPRSRIEPFEAAVRERGVPLEDWLREERDQQAANVVSVSNCVTSLRLLSAIDWPVFYEATSLVTERLRRDPAGVFDLQDFATRDRYRQAVEVLTKGSGLDELAVCDRVLEECGRHAPRDEILTRSVRTTLADMLDRPPESHVGYYLTGEGRPDFGRLIGYRPNWHFGRLAFISAHARALYFGGLIATAAVILLLLVSYARVGGAGWLTLALVVLSGLFLASELAVGLINHLVTKVVPPNTLPKLDFSNGVPAECATFVVIPTLLTSAEGTGAVVDRLETHYLSNPDPQLRFALLTDWEDAATEHLPNDDALAQTALAGIAALNRRYAAGGPTLFFLLHRRRQWNAAQEIWMGWERKRGKLSEFNRLLLGATDTSFTVTSTPPAETPRVRFVITLDSDTQMPRETASRLIGVLAHPLNRPQFDAAQRRVVRGYGVLQPRVSVSLTAARRSRFTRLLAGSAGIDPYTTATSDVYQDLFGLGTFTGKGIYDVKAFEAATGPAFPDNHILSHDLIEGNFARCGLVSDIELIDELPARYNAYSKREHRWVRGDWQLLPWLGRSIPTSDKVTVGNVLPLVERWKILDNLRRSLVPPAVVIFFLMAWIAFPGSVIGWTIFGLAVPFLPLLLNLPTWVWRIAIKPWAVGRTIRDIGPGAVATAGQGVLQTAFLPHQASMNLDAVGRTISRVLMTHENMLEWETAAAAEGRLGNSLNDFIRFMPAAPAVAIVGLILVGSIHPLALLAAIPVLLLWLAAPAIAFWVSQPGIRAARQLTAAERAAMRRIARKTWDFFEVFVGIEDNGLPPDNFQESPKGVVAHRTSPTNIGLCLAANLGGHDFGFISLGRALDRTELALNTLNRMEQHRGHFFNWYDTRSLAPLEPRYVSTVDSGNLFASLFVLRQGLIEKARTPIVGPFVIDGLSDTLGLAVEGIGAAPPASVTTAELQGLGRRLETLPTDLFGWHDRLADLATTAAKLDLENLDHFSEGYRWLSRLAAQISDLQAELAALAPWLPHIVAIQSAGHRPADADGWTKVVARLGQIGSAVELAATAAAAAEELTAQAPTFQNREAQDLCRAAAAACRSSTAPQYAARCENLAEQSDRFAAAMDFHQLYNESRHLFSIGLNLTTGHLDSSHYDLLASESALTSFLCIARGDAHRRHWFQLGRPVTSVGDSLALVSWGGTMFEYLMPRLYLKTFPQTLLDESRHSAVEKQIRYGHEHGVPWGISESGYNFTDADGNYQYQSFGVPGLGLKRGLEQDLVIAPYATVMAVMARPVEAVANFAALTAAGGEGPYGFYEAIDYTPDRVPADRRNVVVRSYMAHHQGMGFLALANVLLGEPFPRRLHAEPMVRATELLLQERVPWEAPLIDVSAETTAAAAAPVPREGEAAVSRRIATPDTALPRTHLISNGEYTVLITSAGGGRSSYRDMDVTRWRADRTTDGGGNFVYVRDLETNAFWAAGHQPVCRAPDTYEAVFAIDKADFRRRDGDFETHLEVTVSTEHPAEIRRVTVTNHDDEPRSVELTSYVELVMQTHNADLAHPAFVKLFLETEYLTASGALLCRRRPRSPGERPIWAVHVAAVEGTDAATPEYDTDRGTVIGRGRTLARPAVLDADSKLAGRTGAVLDPVFCLRRVVRIPAGASVAVTFTTAVAETRDAALALADRYGSPAAGVRAFELAWAHAPVELKHLNITAADAHLYQRLAGHLLYPSPALRGPATVLKANRLAQDGLWRHGISGDFPIVLLAVSSPDDLGMLRQLFLAHTYWRYNGLKADLVVLNEKPSAYYDEFVEQIKQAVRSSPARDVLDRPAGVFVRRADAMTEDERILLRTAARVVLSAAAGGLEEQLDRQEATPDLPPDWLPGPAAVPPNGHTPPAPVAGPADLVFDNGYGGFTPDGKEYVVRVAGQVPPAPWGNIVANAGFGCMLTESALGCTWAANSQTNRLTPWSNDPVTDPPGEAVYIRDEVTGDVWTATPNPLGRGAFTVRHGQGYTVYENEHAGLRHELTVFVPQDDPVKLIVLKLANQTSRSRQVAVAYFAEWVLGGTREQNNQYVVTEVDATSGALFARNPYRFDFGDRVSFADVLHRPRSLTGDRTEFLGRNRSTSDPAAMQRQHLSGRVGPALDPCAALQISVELEPGAEREIVFILGETTDPVAARALLQRYREAGRVHDALAAVRQFWDGLCGAVQVKTPEPALDLLLNRWLPYQVLACRFWGRSAFYQSSGAFGFRDQIQDVLGLVYSAPHLTRDHLLRTAGRQFAAGDVQHWWHPPGGGGVRTRCSDDRLWLPYIALHYLAVTGDASLLEEPVPFLDAPLLRPGQEDSYGKPPDGPPGSFYEHCARAIDISLGVGVHGLPLIGTHDWNDGMNRIGNEGRGESVWLAWFEIAILPEFARIAERRSEAERARNWRDHAERLRKAAEETAWDGNWYRRAYFDDGEPLGSKENVECQIDSLPQTWSVMCGQGDPARAKTAMGVVWDRLVSQSDRLIRLFTPAFDVGNPNPGYVAGYVPGIRENGGQYTHASTWVVPAFAGLGQPDRAVQALALMNPILAAATPDLARKYKTEPYVLAGDVYDNPQHRGRGGWSWYTGSAGWYYRMALEAVLGLEVRGDQLALKPCIPASWPGFTLTLRHRSATYSIQVENAGPGNDVRQIWLDGSVVDGAAIRMADDGREHKVRIVLG